MIRNCMLQKYNNPINTFQGDLPFAINKSVTEMRKCACAKWVRKKSRIMIKKRAWLYFLSHRKHLMERIVSFNCVGEGDGLKDFMKMMVGRNKVEPNYLTVIFHLDLYILATSRSISGEVFEILKLTFQIFYGSL